MLFTHSETLIPQSQAASPHAVFRAANRVGAMFGRAGGAVWRYLEDVGQARAKRELRMLSNRWAVSDPPLASQMREASQFDARSSAQKRQSHEAQR